MEKKLMGFLGTGNMGGALARAAAMTVPADQILLANRHPEKADALGAELGCTVDRAALEQAVVEALHQTLRHLCAPETYIDEYRCRCVTTGKLCRLLPEGREVEALDIDGRYGLVVRYGEELETIRSGEVSVRGLYGYI